MGQDALLLIEVAVGLGIVAIGTVPACIKLVKQLYNQRAKKDTYEAEDGQATPEALLAFSNKWAKMFVLSFASTGFGCQTATAILAMTPLARDDRFWENWLTTVAWVGSARRLSDLHALR